MIVVNYEQVLEFLFFGMQDFLHFHRNFVASGQVLVLQIWKWRITNTIWIKLLNMKLFIELDDYQNY